MAIFLKASRLHNINRIEQESKLSYENFRFTQLAHLQETTAETVGISFSLMLIQNPFTYRQ